MSQRSLTSAGVLTLSLIAAACGTESSRTTETVPAATPAVTPMAVATATPVATAAYDSPVTADPAAAGSSGATATAELMALGASGVTGTVKFTEKDGKVWIEAKIAGLKPGDHGFHIHEFGDCSAPDGTSAGSHFNPGAAPHGPFDPATPHHSGDMGNLVADASGNATLSASTDQFTLGTGASSILGRGLIVHEKADDLKTQPTGDAGGRIACAVIKADSGTTTPVTKPATP